FDSFMFRDYKYTNLDLTGLVKNKIFNGALTVADPNLKFSFEGLVDFSKDENIYDFSAGIEHANLYAMKFVKRDTLSDLRGQMTMDMRGTTIDNVYGAIRFKNALYQNKNDRYDFKDFEITSKFDASNERTIQVNSPEIVQGYLKGKFAIKEVPNLLKNSLGDIYTKFVPFEVNEGQYMNFNFKIYNKIVEIFSPQLKLGSNTFIKGQVESNPKNFNLTFRSPNIRLEDFFANKIEVQLINDNPLFNSYIEVDSLATPFYKASKFSLINVTLNDTLYVKSEFRGGKTSLDEFDLNLYYTIDENNKSVVGIKKSNATFKNTPWLINASQNKQNKIIFDRSFKEIVIDHLKMSYADEEILLNAAINGIQNKTIDLDFKNVDLAKVTPSIDSLKLGGNINGKLSINQRESVYLPKSKLIIDNFEVNDFNLGSFNADIIGDTSLTNYDIKMTLLDGSKESLSVYGLLDVSGENPSINLDINFKDFILDPIGPFGKGVVTNIRGEVSGYAVVSGRLQKPQINGSLKLNQGGLTIPYLNIDYEFKDNTTINLLEQSFIFNTSQLIDSKFRSEGILNGKLSHVNFNNWSLDLNIDSERLLVLNSEESEESLYFGTGFVDGNVHISGPMDQMFIEANVTTSEGTIFKIPISDNEVLGDTSYMHFLSPEEKLEQEVGAAFVIDDVKGVEMEFNMDVNDNAEIEIILDKQTGSSILGRGNGSMLAQINTNGKFKMFGDFIVLSGDYNFTFGRFIQKKFKLIKDGTLVWDGDPLKAEINIKALYDGISVNPSTLLDNPINQSIPTEVEIYLTGELEQPNLDFDIRFPSINSTLNSELADQLRDKDKREFQAMSLLATGAFRSELTLDSQDAFGLVSDGVTSLLNELFADDENKVQLGIDLDIGKTTPEYETDSRVGLTLSTQLSDNILVNGKVGVPVGGLSETTVAGDFEVEVLLNEDRTLSLKFFNRENSIQNFGEQIGYTQGLGISYNIEFDNLRELFTTLFKQNKTQNNTNVIPTVEESTLPEYIDFK
ncbi:translocation/assembly module TamB, partial [Flavobacteriaceae bacterium]|nr:translocation/assembly module TamB [Flavobacteriaceae bacterium]